MVGQKTTDERQGKCDFLFRVCRDSTFTTERLLLSDHVYSYSVVSITRDVSLSTHVASKKRISRMILHGESTVFAIQHEDCTLNV